MARRKRKRLPRWLRIGLMAVLAILVLLPVLLVAFRRPLLRRFALPAIEKAAGEILGLSVKVEDIDLELSGRLVLAGVKAGGPSPRTGLREAAIARTEVSFSIPRLLLGRPDWIEEVAVDGPRLDIDLDHEPLLPPSSPGTGVPSPGPPSLPEVRVSRGEIRISSKGEALEVHGLRLDFSPPGIRLEIQRAEGDWTRPRIEALQFPLAVDARLLSGAGSLTGVKVDRMTMEGKVFAQRLDVDLSTPGEVRIAGGLPGAGLAVKDLRIDSVSLEARVRLEDAQVETILPFFAGGSLPGGRATGGLRLAIPLHGGKSWEAEGELEIADAAWEREGLTAELVTVEAHPAAGAQLEGRAIVRSLSVKGSAPLYLEGSFRREPLPSQDFRILVDETVLRQGKAAVSLGGSLLESDLTVEAALSFSSLPASSLGGLIPSFEDLEGTLDGGISFLGKIGDPSTFLASGRLEARGLRKEGAGDPAMDLKLSASLSDREVAVDDGEWRRGRDEVRFALSSGIFPPSEVDFTLLTGKLFDLPFEATLLPSIRIEGPTFRIGPSRFRLLEGSLELSASGNFEGEVDLYLSSRGLDLSGPLRSSLPEMDPRGIFSCEVELRTSPGGKPSRIDSSFSLLQGAVTAGKRRIEGIEAEGRIDADGGSLRIQDLKVSRGPDKAQLSLTAPVRFTPLPALEGGTSIEASFLVDVNEVADLPIPPGPFREIGGRVVVAGGISAPSGFTGEEPPKSIDLDAAVNVIGGRVKLFGDLPSITEIQAELHLKDEAVEVRGFKGKIRGSDFVLGGEAKVSHPWSREGPGIRQVDLTFSSRNVLVFRSPDLRVRGDVDLRWTGPWEEVSLEGKVKITRAYYLRDISLAPTGGPGLPLQLFSIKEPPFGSLRFKIHAVSDREIILKNNLVSTRASADLTFGGTGLEPVLTGTIITDEGTVNFNESKVNVKSAVVEFLRTDPMNPRLQIVLGNTIRGYDVTVTITGTLVDPEVALDSSPPLERERLLVLISTGLTMEEIEGEGVGQVAAVEAAKYVGRRIIRSFSSKDTSETSFLSRFSVEMESARSSQYQDPLRVDFRLGKDMVFKKDEIFLQGERDTYGDYNFNIGISFELK